MEQIFIANLIIQKVRHLKDISIELSKEKLKHLILTGKNGSGKTSVLDALAGYLSNIFMDEYFEDKEVWLNNAINELERAIKEGKMKQK